MQTKQIYYSDPYKKALVAKILLIEARPNLSNIILDQTIFYPEGGGQPSDTGIVKGGEGVGKVEYVRNIEGEIVHQAKVSGTLNIGENANLELDWNSRYKFMRIHGAGHLLHDVLMKIYPSLVPIKGSHGNKPFLEYSGGINLDDKGKIEEKVNKYLQKDLPIITKEVNFEELKEECQFVPENLPKNKPLRMIRIGDFPSMPDCGVHVKSTREIGKIWIANIALQNGITNIRYGVANVQ